MRVTSENSTRQIRGLVLLASAVAYVYIAAVFTCAYAYAFALVKTRLLRNMNPSTAP